MLDGQCARSILEGVYWTSTPRLTRSKLGSDALSMMVERGSDSTDEAGLEQIKLASPIHLPLDQLELCNLPLGLAI